LEQVASAGELLHTPQRIPTFMATALLSRATDILCGLWRWVSTLAPYMLVWITPHHQYCLPVLVHLEPLNSSHASFIIAQAHRLLQLKQQGQKCPLAVWE